MIKKLLLISLLITFNAISQDKKNLIFGMVLDPQGEVESANIINLRTKQGTFSNDHGQFKMIVSLGDSLKVSSIQHKDYFAAVSNAIIKNEKITIYLQPNIIELEEFDIKRNMLLGILGIDSKSTPGNRKDSLLTETLDFSNVLWNKWDTEDEIDKRVRPHVVATDPTRAFIGAGATITMTFKGSAKYWALVKKLNFKKSFPRKLFRTLGEKFFLIDLQIPPERYYHFLEYCNPLGIEKLFQENKLLEVIKILRQESNTYLDIIKEN